MAASTDKISPQEPISIPATIVEHVLGETTSLLGQGNLTLIHLDTPVGHEIKARKPVFALSIGKAAFSLYADTMFGTLAGNERAYVFEPELGGERRGYVKITLPESVLEEGSPLAEQQECLERILIVTGLLKEGIEATADEIGKSAREGGVFTAQSVREGAQAYLSENIAIEAPVSLMQSAAVASASSTSSLASTVSNVTGAVTSAAGSAGAWIAGHLVPTTSTHTDKLKSLANAYDATADDLSTASAEIKGSLSESAGKVLENDWGQEVRGTAGNTGATVGNVGRTVGDIAVASGAALANAGLKGAVATQTRQQEQKDTMMEAEEEVEDMQAGKDMDQDVVDAEGWRDVPM